MLESILRHPDGREIKVNNGHDYEKAIRKGFEDLAAIGRPETELREENARKLDSLQRAVNPDKEMYK